MTSLKCAHADCRDAAVTFHGITQITHGYCAQHRCCAKCGLPIADCECAGVPTERPEYLEHVISKGAV